MLDFLQSVMQVFARFLLIMLLAQCGAAATPKTGKSGPTRKATPPNLILITLDTTRADRMGFLGSKRGLTPNLDALAQQSVTFTRAYAQVPLTTPSHAALLTGTYPQFNHLEDLGQPLRKDLPFLPELLHQHGYQTAAFIGANILDPKSGAAIGFDRGFDRYDSDFHDPQPGEDRYHSMERRAGDVADRALHWLSQHQKGPFFIWLHFFDPHDPYDPPPPFLERYAAAPYDGEIAYTDSVVGTLMETLRQRGLYQDSVIAIAADHGEAFGEHGEERHGMFLYDETVHVPMLLKLPAQKFAGTRIDPRVALVDIAPSLLQAAGIPAPATMQGQSLFPLLAPAQTSPGQKEKEQDKNNEKVSDRAVYSESNYAHLNFGASELRSWRAGKYLYVQAPRRELYDLPLDPEALKNLSSSAKAVADTLDTQLSRFVVKTSSARVENAKLDPRVAEKLHALGYMASDRSPTQDSQQAAIDPKDRIEVANLYHRALARLEEGQYAQAITELRELATRDPDVAGVNFDLGSALVHQGLYEEALPLLRKAAEKWPDSASPHYQLGLALGDLGQLEAALKEMQAAVVRQPNSANLHFLVATLRVRLQQMPEAMKEYEKTIELDPKHFEANLSYGRLLFMQGRAKAAAPILKRAIKLKPESMEAHMSLADVYTKLGQTEKADRELAEFQRLFKANQH
jgi:arylsulfatase A-like enzyme/Flp pilus assembly protein TadD